MHFYAPATPKPLKGGVAEGRGRVNIPEVGQVVGITDITNSTPTPPLRLGSMHLQST